MILITSGDSKSLALKGQHIGARLNALHVLTGLRALGWHPQKARIKV